MRRVTVDERTGNGAYADVLAAIEFHQSRFGSAPNSLVQIVRASPLYAEAKRKLGSNWPGEAPTPKRGRPRKGKR